MSRSKRFLRAFALVLLLSVAFVLPARADIVVSTGYYDLTGRGNLNALPNPWYGSPNTTFDGDPGVATLTDPDEAGVLLYNNGLAPVTLTAFSIVSSTNTWAIWNSYIGSGQVIAPGTYLIFSGTGNNSSNNMDGSDGGLNNSTVYWTIDGTPGSASDVVVQSGPGQTGSLNTGVLTGSNIGSANETMPWTQIADLGGTSAVPEPETGAMLVAGLGVLQFFARRRSRCCPRTVAVRNRFDSW